MLAYLFLTYVALLGTGWRLRVCPAIRKQILVSVDTNRLGAVGPGAPFVLKLAANMLTQNKRWSLS